MLLADMGYVDLAERAFRTAIQVARAQSADSWAHRALGNLTDLLSREGRATELGTGTAVQHG